MESIKRLLAHSMTGIFLTSEHLRSRTDGMRGLRILFSKKSDWESMIAHGFRRTHHRISFGELVSETLTDYDLVVPLTVPDLKYLNCVRHLIPDNPIPIPSIESIELCDDKELFNQTLIAHGLGAVIPQVGGRQTYPYIVKKKIDDYGTHSYIISDAQKERMHAELLTDPDYFTQKFIPGPHEFATHIICRGGKIVCSLNIKYSFPKINPIKGKDKVNYIQLCRCPYHDLFESILEAVGFEGLCCFNYKIYEGQLYMLEINPRFGSSLSRFFFSFIRHLDHASVGRHAHLAPVQ